MAVVGTGVAATEVAVKEVAEKVEVVMEVVVWVVGSEAEAQAAGLAVVATVEEEKVGGAREEAMVVAAWVEG